MTNGNFVSIKQVANKLMQNPLMANLSWEFIVSNAVEVMRIVGTPAMYVNKKHDTEIVNYKGSLPVDMMIPDQVIRVENNQLIPMVSASDTLHEHYDTFNSAAPQECEGRQLTYSMNNSRIFTSFKEGTVVLTYKAIATDEDCFPMVPNNAELLRAIESYIKYRWFDILNDMDEISDRKLHKAETDYAFNVGQAQSNMQMPSIDEMEKFVNSITQILPSRTQHSQRFRFLGEQEFLRVQ